MLILELEILDGRFKSLGEVIGFLLCGYAARYVRHRPAREPAQCRDDAETGPDRARRGKSVRNYRNRQLKVVSRIETICFLTQGYNGRTRRLKISGGFVDFDLEVVEPHPVLNACRLAPALFGILAAEALAFEGLDRFVRGIDDAVDRETVTPLEPAGRLLERNAEQTGRLAVPGRSPV